jgi:hypothetical protein
MLFEPDRHEPLREIAWDEAAARTCIQAILRDAVDCFSAQGIWPAHPLDRSSTDGRDDLYLGASGTLWALNHLASNEDFAGMKAELADINQAWLARVERDDEPGLLSAGSGSLLLRAMLEGIEPVAKDLVRHIDANSDSPVLEFMWGSPGTMTAAAWLFEQTGNDIWADRFRRDARRLWDRLEFVEEAGCHLWVQHLYGRVAPFLGAVHGFAGNAFAVIHGWALLSPVERSRWSERIGESLRATAIVGDGEANWPQSIGRHRPGRHSLLLQHCHGAPGIVTCLAGFPDSSIDDLLSAAGELTWRAGPLTKGPGLCHGTAGNGYALLKFYRRTGEPLWLERARHFAMHAIAQLEQDKALHGQARYPLWTGDPGVAIYLANCIAGSDKFPTMDEFFSP